MFASASRENRQRASAARSLVKYQGFQTNDKPLERTEEVTVRRVFTLVAIPVRIALANLSLARPNCPFCTGRRPRNPWLGESPNGGCVGGDGRCHNFLVGQRASVLLIEM